jgi:uncharacterized membrane protein YdjX (TVP38/TMEM64 family)
MTPELRALARPALFLAGLLAGGFALHLISRAGGLDPAALNSWIVGQGWLGRLAFIGIGAAACAVGMPRQAVAFAGGYAFGAVHGSLAAWAAMLLGLAAAFWWARLAGRAYAQRRLSGKLRRIDRFIAENPFSATLTLRLLPVGNNLALNLLAGLSGVAFGPFLAGSAIGYLPQTIVFALLGKGVRIEREVQIALGVVLFLASALMGLWLLSRHRRAQALAGAAGLGE